LYREVVRRALAEDLGWGDVTTEATVPADLRAHGVILAKSPCIIAGLDVAAEVFTQLDPGCQFDRKRRDSERCEPGDVVAEVRGGAAAMITAERTALNFLEAAGGKIIVLDTRKTTPTLRALEKYAVRAGSGTNHRAGLDDGILIKDNHIRLAGGVAEAVKRMKDDDPEMPIEIEAQSLEQVDQALAAGVDIILVDNLPLDVIKEAVRRAQGRAKVEISGGVTLERLPELATTGANYVSVGALTHSAPAADLSFELEPA
jgi:nicotinate-nucleotide pyrophosphorylase (carboxylating)